MPFEVTRLNHITVNAPSGAQDKVQWFYGHVLGLKEIPIPKALEGVYEITWFQMCDFILHIEYTKTFVKPHRDERGVIMPGNHFAVEVKNIKELRKELESKHVVIKESVPIADRERFYLVDPFDNYIEIIEFYKK